MLRSKSKYANILNLVRQYINLDLLNLVRVMCVCTPGRSATRVQLCTRRSSHSRGSIQYTYCTLGHKEINTWRAHGAAARVSVNFLKFSPCIACARRARGFDSLPSLSDVGTLSFRWNLPFWYFCFLLTYKLRLAVYLKIKQKYQNGNIHRKLRVPTSVIFSEPSIQYCTIGNTK